MECGDFGRWANRKNLLSQCGRFWLDEVEAESIIDRIVDTVRTSWRDVFSACGVSNEDQATIESAMLYDGFEFTPDGWRPARPRASRPTGRNRTR